jgi:flagellar M-ring protein FliF
MDELRKAFGQAAELWKKLPRGRRFILVAALLATAATVTALSLRGESVKYATLFAGMSPEDAGAVIEQLKADKIPFRLANAGTSVEVPEDKVHETRLILAQKGMPRGGGIGFEIFDKQTFGTTSFVEKTNYQRALQGELARSIMSLDEVETARVHLALPERSLYKRSEETPSASVALRLRGGRRLGPAQVRGIVHLVAGSVEGMTAERVTVVDDGGRVLSGGDDSAGMLEAQQNLEHVLEARIREVVERLVGEGKAIVVVTAEMDQARTERTEELYDKEKTALRSEARTEEHVGDGSDTASGVAGARGNLPGAPAPQTGVAGGSGVTRLSETKNYEVNRVIQKTIGPAIRLKQLHVAVLVEQPTATPRTPEELASISALVREAGGLSKERADSLEVHSAPFAVRLPEPTAEPPAAPVFLLPWLPLPLPVLAAAAGGLLLMLIAVGYVLLRKKKKRPAVVLPALPMRLDDAEAMVERGQLGPGATAGALPPGPPQKTPRDRALEAARTDAVRAARLISAWLGEKSA